MPVGAARFVRTGRHRLSAALGGIPAARIAAYIVNSLPVLWLKWLVTGVVLYAAVQMLRSAGRS